MVRDLVPGDGSVAPVRWNTSPSGNKMRKE